MLDNKIPDRTPYKISVSVQLDSTADQFRNIRYILSQPHIELGIQTGVLLIGSYFSTNPTFTNPVSTKYEVGFISGICRKNMALLIQRNSDATFRSLSRKI